MELKKVIGNVFNQISDLLSKMSTDEYTSPSKNLSDATIGQHLRHIIELYTCLFNGYETGALNYEERKRDIRIESDKDLAKELMLMIINNIDKPDIKLVLHSNYDELSDEMIRVETNYFRELIYNLEHTVHHMALIKVGLKELTTINIPEGFAVACSTLKYRKSCAQ